MYHLHNENLIVDNRLINDELTNGIVSSTTLAKFIRADRSNAELSLKWLELKLIVLERRIKQGMQIIVVDDDGELTLTSKESFYEYCKMRFTNAYSVFLKGRHY